MFNSPMFLRLKPLCSSPILLHYALPVLMIYLLAGTIAQKYIGLYEATQIFFASPLIWLGPIPLPGLPLVLSIIAVNLLCKLLFKSPWRRQQAGTIITHIGALLLLGGGLLTALFSTEGYMDLSEGAQSAIVSDYHARTFTLSDQNQTPILTLDFPTLHKGQIIQTPEIKPLKIEILDLCRNCTIKKRENADETYHGMAQHMQLESTALKNSNEENMSALTLKISGATEEQNGIYVVLEDVPQIPQFTAQDKTIFLSLQKSKRTLPFTLELIDFKREMYPGSDKPKSYESRVRIHDNGLEWESIISMNAPLRYKGYTFFQSSFITTPDGDISVLAVVWNAGRTFPYIASIAMCLGILLHLIVRAKR